MLSIVRAMGGELTEAVLGVQEFGTWGNFKYDTPHFMPPRCFDYQAIHSIAAGESCSLGIAADGTLYSWGFGVGLGRYAPPYKMNVCGCPTSSRQKMQKCPDPEGHKRERANLQFQASGPVHACPLGKKNAHMLHPGTAHERLMSASQMYTPQPDGTRMLIQPTCMSIQEAFACSRDKVLAFMMHTTKRLDITGKRPDICTEVWRHMDKNNFLGWPGHDEVTVDFQRDHPTEDNEYPARTWGNEAWPKEFSDAVTNTHRAEERMDFSESHHDLACVLFARSPMGYIEAQRQTKLLDDSHGNGVPFRLKWTPRAPDTPISTNQVTKFKHANILAVLGMPRYTENGLHSCRQIQDYPLALHFSSNWVSRCKHTCYPPHCHDAFTMRI